jgi:methyl-accepting chemotaxis protein
VVVDIYPPVLYISEELINSYQMLYERDIIKSDKLYQKSRKFKAEYEERNAYWIKNLEEGELKTKLTVESDKYINEFFNLKYKEFVPLLARREYAEAQNVLINKMEPTFAKHAAIIYDCIKIAEKKESEIEAEANKIIKMSTYITLFALILAMILIISLAAYFTGLIIKSIDEFQDILKNINQGEKNLTIRARLKTRDEMYQLSEFFNIFLERFHQFVINIAKNIDELGRSSQALTTATHTISQIASQQSTSVRDIYMTMQEVHTQNTQVASSITEVTKITSKTRENVEHGVKLVRENLSKMDTIKDKNFTNITGIKDLGEKIESVWDIVNIINGIVEQTRIIAFNAELEAAAAGEAGKNFQVVASEIRRLADSTNASTREIRSKINEIEKSSNKLIIMSEENTEIIKEGWDVSNKLESIFKEIKNSAEISEDSASQIELLTRQQIAAFEHILESVKKMSDTNESFVSSSLTTSETAEVLARIAGQLEKNTEGYKV